MMYKSIFTCLFLILCLVSCKDDENIAEPTACEGSEEMTLQNLTGLLDGCGWVLNRIDGTRIEPMNLGDYSVVLEDGKAVQVLFEVDQNAASICLVGDIVRLTCFEE